MCKLYGNVLLCIVDINLGEDEEVEDDEVENDDENPDECEAVRQNEMELKASKHPRGKNLLAVDNI